MKKMKLESWQQILLALILGVLVGFYLEKNVIYIKPFGFLFLHAIQMMIVPVVFTAIVCSVLSMDDLKAMQRVSIKVICLYSLSMGVSAVIGLSVATWLSPGSGLHLAIMNETQIIPVGFLDTIVNVVPSNPFKAFSESNILQVLIFALFIGVSINLAGEKAKPVAQLFYASQAVTIQLAKIVMKFAPIGIFSLMAWVVGEYGLHSLFSLLKLVMTIYLCCFILCIVFYSAILLFYVRMNPFYFFQNIKEAILLAFTTSSSAATLPVTIRCAQDNLNISKKLSSFLLPLGTTMNLNGLSIYLSVATVFAANAYGIDLNFSQYITIVITIILMSMGAGGVPGSAIIVMSAVMNSVGLPLGAVSLIAGVDRLNDMAQTTINVIGDLFATVVIADNENEFVDEELIEHS